MKFIIMGGGDSSVGIPSSEEIVTFEGNCVWDDDQIQRTKELLTEWDDNGADVQTEEEYIAQIDAEEKCQKESLVIEIERQYNEKSKKEFIKFIKELLGD